MARDSVQSALAAAGLPPPGTPEALGLISGRKLTSARLLAPSSASAAGSLAAAGLPQPGSRAAAELLQGSVSQEGGQGLTTPQQGAASQQQQLSAGGGDQRQGESESEQMAEYNRYVAALQLQYAAIGASQDQAQSTGSGGDFPTAFASGSRESRGLAQPHDPKRRFTGSVFKWDDDSGWGFISCLDARKVYGKDVFLHKAEIGGVADLYRQRTKVEVKNGEWVVFSVEISRGKPRARDVEKVDTPDEYRKPGEAKKLAATEAEESEPLGKKRRET